MLGNEPFHILCGIFESLGVTTENTNSGSGRCEFSLELNLRGFQNL